MDKKIQTIIEAGIMAPSGDNCQPWRFEANNNCIDIFNLPDRDTSLYNYKQRASLVAHGACLENMLIAARKLGFSAEVRYFPTPKDEQHVARLDLIHCTTAVDSLFEAIPERAINRKIYRGGTLSAEALEQIHQTATVTGVTGCSLKLLQGVEKEAAAEIVALSDRLVFENPHLHGFLFDHIRWNPEEAERTRDGLDIRTLELAPPDRLFFPLLKNFGFVKFISHFGTTKIIAANAKKLMLSSSAAGIITVTDTSPESWLNAGRMLERVWLEATRQGLAFHLMTGITLLVQRIRDGELEGLNIGNISMVKQAENLLTQTVCSEFPVALLFRVGKAEIPRVRSLRKCV